MKITVLLAALSATLALLVAYQLYETPEAVIMEPSASPARTVAGEDRLPSVLYSPKQAYEGINDDNLFAPDRAPVPVSADPGPARRMRAATGQPRFELKGIVITPTGRQALLKLHGESDYRKVEKGENVEGWVIDAIETDSILVKNQGTSAVVKLKTPESPLRRVVPRTRSNTSRTQQ